VFGPAFGIALVHEFFAVDQKYRIPLTGILRPLAGVHRPRGSVNVIRDNGEQRAVHAPNQAGMPMFGRRDVRRG
jgi:hypothetical protein